jgi:cation:H+ antiporter
MPGAESAWSILWTAPAILLASLMIAWAAESAQFFMAQGFALVILAWMQTLPEFAVEGVLAWHGQTHLLIANLSGAIRLLTGLGWPLIYAAAAFSYRRKYGRPMREIVLDPHQSTSVVSVFGCLIYVAVIAAKGSLGLIDAAVLIAIYAVYLYVIRQLPAEDSEDIAHLEGVPRAIVKARRPVRIAAIFGLFIAGGAIIVFVAEPFVGSMAAISTTLGISQFIFIQWVAPFVSEFPEGVSAFYWARGITDAPMAFDEYGFQQPHAVGAAGGASAGRSLAWRRPPLGYCV